MRILIVSYSFEGLVTILRRYIELRNHYKILILEPIKDKFNHTKYIKVFLMKT